MINFLTSLDITLFYFFNQTLPHQGILKFLFLTIDYLTPLIWILILSLSLFPKDKKKKIFGRISLLNFISTVLIVEALKVLIRKPRPFLVLEGVQQLKGILLSTYSFPSLHAAISCSLATFHYLALPKEKSSYILLVFVLLASIGRIYIGVHYPSDILAGIILGSTCSLVANWSFKKYKAKSYPKGRKGGNEIY